MVDREETLAGPAALQLRREDSIYLGSPESGEVSPATRAGGRMRQLRLFGAVRGRRELFCSQDRHPQSQGGTGLSIKVNQMSKIDAMLRI